MVAPRGAVLEKSITPMRSFVAAPMRYRSLFLAGDAAHIVPPTGAKGLNLAFADVTVLAQALIAHFGSGSDAGLDEYSERCLRRVWRAQHFSWWMTTMLHRDPGDDAYGRRLQRAQLRVRLQLERRGHVAGGELRRPAARAAGAGRAGPWLS